MTTPVQIHDHATDNERHDRGFSERDLLAKLHDPVQFARILDEALFQSDLGPILCGDAPNATRAVTDAAINTIRYPHASRDTMHLVDSVVGYDRTEVRASSILLGVAYERLRHDLVDWYRSLEREPNEHERKFMEEVRDLKAKHDNANQATADAAE